MRLRERTGIILVSLLIIVAIYLFSYQNTPTADQPTKVDEEVNNTIVQNLGNNTYLVDIWTLKYYRTNWSEPRPFYDYGPFSIVFEVPEDDVVIQFNGTQVIPEDEFFLFPLVVYKGNAYSVDSNPFWINNMTCLEPFEIEVSESGWYTVSLTGYVMENGHRYSLRGWGNSTPDTVLIYVSLSLKKNGDPLSFKIDNRIWE